MLVRQAAAVADLSGGRLHLGIGAGWQEREHTTYGYHLGSVPERMARFRESVQIIAHLLRSNQPLTFEGQYYMLREAVLLPRPAHRVPLVIGGAGRKVMLPLVARHADEWNCGPRWPEEFGELNAHLDELLDQAGRPRSSVRRSMMVFIRADARLRTNEQIAEHVAALEAAGVQRVMLNWRDDYDDTAGMAALARALI
jgi:alkanesulfonate monooxygenase SsuD/methylene tetrahydromethanopterin reductase-like flavin-dependent oxidoreductase (luciferase family)